MIMDENIQEEMTRGIAKQQQKLKIAQNLRKLKKKRKLAYYYALKNRNLAKLYDGCCEQKYITIPKNFVPKHRQEETKQECEVRLKHCKYRLMQDKELLQLRADRYTEKFRTLDKDIDIPIEMKYSKTPPKIDHFKEQ